MKARIAVELGSIAIHIVTANLNMHHSQSQHLRSGYVNYPHSNAIAREAAGLLPSAPPSKLDEVVDPTRVLAWKIPTALSQTLGLGRRPEGVSHRQSLSDGE